MIFEEDEKEKEDAELPDDALDEVLGGADLDDEDDPLMAEDPVEEEGKEWA